MRKKGLPSKRVKVDWNITALPGDLLRFIMVLLDFRSVSALSSTCTRFWRCFQDRRFRIDYVARLEPLPTGIDSWIFNQTQLKLYSTFSEFLPEVGPREREVLNVLDPNYTGPICPTFNNGAWFGLALALRPEESILSRIDNEDMYIVWNQWIQLIRGTSKRHWSLALRFVRHHGIDWGALLAKSPSKQWMERVLDEFPRHLNMTNAVGNLIDRINTIRDTEWLQTLLRRTGHVDYGRVHYQNHLAVLVPIHVYLLMQAPGLHPNRLFSEFSTTFRRFTLIGISILYVMSKIPNFDMHFLPSYVNPLYQIEIDLLQGKDISTYDGIDVLLQFFQHPAASKPAQLGILRLRKDIDDYFATNEHSTAL